MTWSFDARIRGSTRLLPKDVGKGDWKYHSDSGGCLGNDVSQRAMVGRVKEVRGGRISPATAGTGNILL